MESPPAVSRLSKAKPGGRRRSAFEVRQRNRSAAIPDGDCFDRSDCTEFSQAISAGHRYLSGTYVGSLGIRLNTVWRRRVEENES